MHTRVLVDLPIRCMSESVRAAGCAGAVVEVDRSLWLGPSILLYKLLVGEAFVLCWYCRETLVEGLLLLL